MDAFAEQSATASAVTHYTSLDATARSSDNLVPAIIESVKAHATLGEISDRLRVAFGEHRELITV